MQTSQPLCRGSAWIMENFLSRCIMKSTGPICMDIRKSLRLMLFLLAPLQGCALDRLCEYDLQYEAAALEISENENAGPLEDVTESSEESDVDHSELEQVQSSRSLTQSSDTDSELEEENHPVQGFVIEYMIHEKEEKG